MFWTYVGAVVGGLFLVWCLGQLRRRLSLHGAAERGDSARVQALLSRRPDCRDRLDWEGRSALYWAARYNREATVTVLLDAHAAPDAGRDWTPLFIATHAGHSAIVKKLIDAGADVNRQDRYGCTPLMEAVRYGHDPIVDLLIAHGADVNHAAQEGETALHWAAKTSWEGIVKKLLAAGAHREATYRDGWTPLHFAAGEGNAAVIELLIAAGAQVDARTQSDGRTPLHRAAREGHTAAVAVLIKHKADVNVRNTYGKSVLYYTKHFPDTRKLLQANGAAL